MPSVSCFICGCSCAPSAQIRRSVWLSFVPVCVHHFERTWTRMSPSFFVCFWFSFSERPRPYFFFFFSTFHVLRFPFGVAIRTLETQVQPRELKCARLLRRTRGGGGGDVCVQSAAVSFVRCGLFCPRCGRPCT